MLADCLSARSSRLLLSCLPVAASCLIGMEVAASLPGPALADSDAPILLNMPVYSQVFSNDLISQAESMVSRAINHYFDANPSLTEVEVVVLGNSNGNIIPILTTSVARTQWQGNPLVSAWTKYYGAHALLQQHSMQPAQIAATPSHRSTSVGYQSTSAQFDQQFDSGQLSGETVQSYLDFVD